ncbi:MAG: mandelate racemase [Alphaproteobacteria bacterium]|nr:mandelate racemase [Alphaproteobacteria bacterium]
MKIKGVKTFILRQDIGDKAFYSSQARFSARSSMIVRIETDDGTVGWGEAGQYGPPEPPAACIDEVLAPQLIGRRADEPVRVFDDLYAFCRDFGQKGPYIEALSAVDIALWDIWGQSLGRPVHALMGGAVRDRVAAYGTGCYYPDFFTDTDRMLKALADETAALAKTGLTAMKVKIGLVPVEVDVERLSIVRGAFGPGFPLMADANHAYNAATAIRMGRALEAENFLWFEEPVVPEDRDGYRRVRAALDVPIAGGECEYTRYGFRDLIGEGCVDIAQPDICCAGGFSELQKIVAIATSHGVMTVPHVWGSGIAVAAALQAIATLPLVPHTAVGVPLQNQPVIEFDRSPNPIRDELLETPFTLEDGCLPVPQGPGLGVVVNESKLEEFTNYPSPGIGGG